MENTELVAVATKEIENPVFGVTEQFLQVHKVAYEDGKPVVAGVKVEEEDQSARIYFSVIGERFHFVVYIDTLPKIRVRGVDTADYCDVYFRATSEELTLQQMASLTVLPYADESWDKGSQRRTGSPSRKFSALVLRLPQKPGELDSKLKPLLSFLEQDADGLKTLIDQYNGGIGVHTIFHNGNTMLGGFHLDKEDIRRLAALNLEIDFDLYAEGNFFE